MYNKQLDTFISIADLGSFSKAAEALYITPSAVIQQINILESNLNTELFIRSNQGVKLTEAGKFFYDEVKNIINNCNDVRNQIGFFNNIHSNIINVGTGLLYKCRVFYDYWHDFNNIHKNYKVHFSQFNYSPNFDGHFDIVECIDDKELLQTDLEFLELCQIPIGCAAPRNHPLADKKLITIDDLKGYVFVNSPIGLKKEFEDLQDMLIQNNVKVINPDRYQESTFSTCLLNNYIMQIPLCWKDIVSDFITIPVDWNYTISYGFFYNKNSKKVVKEFIKFVKEYRNKDIKLY
ncbi:MAG: LysR family transcriptional regulator [Clostridiaceae bacterium]|nr:LysR family transcriptional regulator [Clostridiaceae bacterium]